MGFKLYRDEDGEGTVLEKPDGDLVKLPSGGDEDTYQVPADLLAEVVSDSAGEIEEE